MGQAKRRGTFEERKAEAVSAGRVKVSMTEQKAAMRKLKRSLQPSSADEAMAIMDALMGVVGKVEKRWR